MQLSELLRAQTEEQNKQLEKKLFWQEIKDGSLTIQQYKEFLEIHHSIVEPFEDEWRAICEANTEIDELWEQRWKTELLQNDLTNLGEEDFKNEKYIFNSWSFNKMLGAAYIIEASTLRALHISRYLKENIAVPNNIMEYLDNYGDETENKWNSFIAFLDSQETEHHQEIINGALQTNKLFLEKADEIKAS